VTLTKPNKKWPLRGKLPNYDLQLENYFHDYTSDINICICIIINLTLKKKCHVQPTNL